MMFSKLLRGPITRGDITRSVRIWLQPRVKIGGRYPLEGGWVEVTGLQEVDLADLTDELARETGFSDLAALLATARHGRGERVFLVDFVFSDSGE